MNHLGLIFSFNLRKQMIIVTLKWPNDFFQLIVIEQVSS